MFIMASSHFPWTIQLTLIAGGGLLVYYLYKKNKFPFEQGGIFDTIRSDVSGVATKGQLPLRDDGSGQLPPPQQGGQQPQGFPGGGNVPGLPGNPNAPDYSIYEQYVQGLKAQFPQNQQLGPGGVAIGGDATTFGAVGPGGINPPIQPYPAQGLLPPPTMQQYPYYRPTSIPVGGGGVPYMPPGYNGRMPYPYGGRPPMPYPPPYMYDDVWDIDWEKYKKPRSTSSSGGIDVGPIHIGSDGIRVGDLINLGGGLSGQNISRTFGNGQSSSIVNGQVQGIPSASSINSQVNSMLNDIFAQVGINR